MRGEAAMSVGSWMGRSVVLKRRRRRWSGGNVRCAAATVGSLTEQHRMLRVQPGALEKEVKKAFRQLALQYHPDICKGDNCGVQFHRIKEAYDIVMNCLRQSEAEQRQFQEWSDDGSDESTMGMYDPSWDLWEEWMGWEGAGITDYSSHINPYV